MKRAALCLTLLFAAVLLGGCSSLLAGDYYHETDYYVAAQDDKPAQGSVTVKNAEELKKELLGMVYAAKSEGVIAFDPAYAGDIRADLEDACGTMHREDALWAYCVRSAHYEISHIVTHDEASVFVEYAESTLPADQILQLTYATGLNEIMAGAMEKGTRNLVILIERSSYSVDNMARLVRDVYRNDPSCSPVNPTVDVYMYSGAGRQRLYDIELDYRLDEETLQERRAALEAFDAQELLHDAEQTKPMAALEACQYLVDNCAFVNRSGSNTVYDALIAGEANSEGLALAYVELCHEIGVPCKIVYGQYLWRDHCWNIIELEGQHYHVDLTACIRDGVEHGFLLGDEQIWTEYRWDTSSYEQCGGPLNYRLLMGLGPEEEANPAEEPDEPAEEPDEPAEEPAGESPAPSGEEKPEPEETPVPEE